MRIYTKPSAGLVAKSTEPFTIAQLEVSNRPRATRRIARNAFAAVAAGALTSLGLGMALPAPQAHAQDTSNTTTQQSSNDTAEIYTIQQETLKLTNATGEATADQNAIDKFAESLQGKKVSSIYIEATASDKNGSLDTSAGIEDEDNIRLAITRAHFADLAVNETELAEVETFLTASEVIIPTEMKRALSESATVFGYGTIDEMWNKYQNNKATGIDDLPPGVADFFKDTIEKAQGVTITANVVESARVAVQPSGTQKAATAFTANTARSPQAAMTPSQSPLHASSNGPSGNSNTKRILFGLAATAAAVVASRKEAVRKAPKKLYKTIKANIPTQTGRYAWTQHPKYNEYLKYSAFQSIDKVTYQVGKKEPRDLRIAYVGHNPSEQHAQRVEDLITEAVSRNPAILNQYSLVAVYNEGDPYRSNEEIMGLGEAYNSNHINTTGASRGVLEININPQCRDFEFGQVAAEVLWKLGPTHPFARQADVHVVDVQVFERNVGRFDPRIKRYEKEARERPDDQFPHDPDHESKGPIAKVIGYSSRRAFGPEDGEYSTITPRTNEELVPGLAVEERFRDLMLDTGRFDRAI